MINLLGLSTAELKAVARACGQPEYRGAQFAKWLFQRGEFELDAMSDLPKAFRAQIASDDRVMGVLSPVHVKEAPDGTRKYLFSSASGGTLEAVLMPYWASGDDPQTAGKAPGKGGSNASAHRGDAPTGRSSSGPGAGGPAPDRVTACISTQVGCAVACAFCATGFSGFQKNVSAGEMVEQVVRIQREAGMRVSNVVFMGMGEPFLNYDETLKAVRLLNEEVGIGMRHLTISTSGIIPGIDRLAQEKLQLTLAVSLHAPNDALRDRLVPINRRYPLADLKAAMRRYVDRTSRRITLEYVMLRGVNDDVAQARELARYLEGLGAHVNLIPYNATDAAFAPSRPKEIAAFREVLERAGRAVTVRVERGADIDAACGQLRRRLAETGAEIRVKSPVGNAEGEIHEGAQDLDVAPMAGERSR